ncbi:MAG: 4-hydroxythreonine-4-phosphate dehydrogenase PdxA [Rhodospirillaceae bacterium TMED167]|nr:4-hydroxythreonine-4-phosphate dehydrogenase PdxA [Rhodospirillaceae bacterium]OUW23445.1 MAG: 4-hydroxythreonine-4-phosphate dehydrogenase PdxA [Rhodospirillaceae bacterium TMED167]
MTVQTAPVAITMGDPGGIGAEITLKSWRDHRANLAPFYVIDDPIRLERINRQLNLNCAVAPATALDQVNDLFKEALPVYDLGGRVISLPGEVNAQDAPLVLKSIKIAVEHVCKGQASALVTNPVHKASLYESGFSYPGHTEFLADLASVATEPVMMLASDRLRVVPVTRHLALGTAISTLSEALIVETAEITTRALQRDFGITAPRISIAGLNPHAGEGGAMGREDIDIINPAINKLIEQGVAVSGPLSADTLFHDSARETYDAALCMYHDQALIPIKTLDFYTAVNVTLGLPFIRTSPDHGTALDIAGTDVATETSLVAAIKMASDMARMRARYDTRA